VVKGTVRKIRRSPAHQIIKRVPDYRPSIIGARGCPRDIEKRVSRPRAGLSHEDKALMLGIRVGIIHVTAAQRESKAGSARREWNCYLNATSPSFDLTACNDKCY
jgi:hypothetical protein